MSGSQPPGPEYDRLDFDYITTKNALCIENDENRNVDKIMVVVYDDHDDDGSGDNNDDKITFQRRHCHFLERPVWSWYCK